MFSCSKDDIPCFSFAKVPLSRSDVMDVLTELTSLEYVLPLASIYENVFELFPWPKLPVGASSKKAPANYSMICKNKLNKVCTHFLAGAPEWSYGL